MITSAPELRSRILSGEIDLDEYYSSVFASAAAQNTRFNCLIAQTNDLAQQTIDRLKKQLAKGEAAGKLFGVPVVVKDNICLKDYPTTCGSRMLANFVPPYNATVVEQLLAADAVIIAKANMDEFAMGSSNETSAFGVVRNPHDTSRIPGGSSGGSAVAVAAGMVPVALGSDTGGSIRQPAALCGVVGLKPTYGSVSRYGLVAFASSMDQIGPLGVDVESVAMLFDVISAHDPNDSTSVGSSGADTVSKTSNDIRDIKIGLPREYFAEGLDNEIRVAIEKLIDLLKGEKAEFVNVSLPHTKYAIAAYYIVADAEASSNLGRYDGVKYGYRDPSDDLYTMYTNTRRVGFGAEVKRRIMLGTYVLSAGYYDAYYQKAMQVREIISEDFQKTFEKVDLLLTPTTPTTAFRLGEKLDDPLAMYLSDVYTVSANLAGLPAMSLPCGIDSRGLPIGVQLIGRHFDEGMLFRVGRAIERVLG